MDDAVRTDDPVQAVEREVARLLRLADRSRRRSPLLERTLERASYLALALLEEQGPVTINDLADALRLDASTVTRQVIAMEAAGHVTRGRDDADARRTVVTMTPGGAAALADTRQARHAVYSDVLQDWSAADREHLAGLLVRLNQDLDVRARAVDGLGAPPEPRPAPGR